MGNLHHQLWLDIFNEVEILYYINVESSERLELQLFRYDRVYDPDFKGHDTMNEIYYILLW
jgi:hypothetical protein